MTNTEKLMEATGLATEKPKTFKDLVSIKLEKGKDAIMALMPSGINKDALIRTALILAGKPEFQGCKVNTFLTSFATASQLGFQPNTPLGHCYLLPYNKNVKNGNNWDKVKEVQLIIGYKGMIDLARRSGQIESINSYLVYKDDEFNITLGLNPNIHHIPSLQGSKKDDDIVFVYAIAKLKGGGVQFEYMDMADIAKARKASSADTFGKYSPWINYFGEMCRKTAIRKLFKYLPVSLEIANIIRHDEKAEAVHGGLEWVDDENTIDVTAEVINNID